MVEAPLVTFFTMIIEIEVANKFKAVPTKVWSALNLMQATANKPEYNIPTIIDVKIVKRTTKNGFKPKPSPPTNLSTNNPAIPPTTITPSKPMLITPDLSENIPPKATSINDIEKINI